MLCCTRHRCCAICIPWFIHTSCMMQAWIPLTSVSTRTETTSSHGFAPSWSWVLPRAVARRPTFLMLMWNVCTFKSTSFHWWELHTVFCQFASVPLTLWRHCDWKGTQWYGVWQTFDQVSLIRGHPYTLYKRHSYTTIFKLHSLAAVVLDYIEKLHTVYLHLCKPML